MKKKIHFLHIGKNAGNQILHLCRQLEKFDFEFIKENHRTKKYDLPKNSKYFFSIRDPITRFVSGFYSRKRKGMPKYYSEWSPDEKFAFSQFDHANDLAESLLREDDIGEKALVAANSISHIAMHQVDWFTKSSNLIQDPPLAIIRVEKFNYDFNRFLKKLGIDKCIEDLNISDDPTIAHKNNYTKIPNLSQLAIKNLKIWYARDIIFYNYCSNLEIN